MHSRMFVKFKMRQRCFVRYLVNVFVGFLRLEFSTAIVLLILISSIIQLMVQKAPIIMPLPLLCPINGHTCITYFINHIYIFTSPLHVSRSILIYANSPMRFSILAHICFCACLCRVFKHWLDMIGNHWLIYFKMLIHETLLRFISCHGETHQFMPCSILFSTTNPRSRNAPGALRPLREIRFRPGKWPRKCAMRRPFDFTDDVEVPTCRGY